MTIVELLRAYAGFPARRLHARLRQVAALPSPLRYFAGPLQQTFVTCFPRHRKTPSRSPLPRCRTEERRRQRKVKKRYKHAHGIVPSQRSHRDTPTHRPTRTRIPPRIHNYRYNAAAITRRYSCAYIARRHHDAADLLLPPPKNDFPPLLNLISPKRDNRIFGTCEARGARGSAASRRSGVKGSCCGKAGTIPQARDHRGTVLGTVLGNAETC